MTTALFETLRRSRRKAHIATTFAVVVLLALGLASLAQWRRTRLLDTATERRLQELARRVTQAADMLDRWVDMRYLEGFEATVQLSRRPASEDEATRLESLAEYLQRHEYVASWLIDSAGGVVDGDATRELLGARSLRLARDAARRRTQAIVGPVVLPTGAARIYVVSPTLGARGALVLAVDPGLSLFQDLAVAGAADGGSLQLRLLTADSGIIRVGSPASARASYRLGAEVPIALAPPAWRAAVTGSDTALVDMRGDDGTVLSAAHPLRADHLGVVMEVDSGEALLPATQRFRSEVALTIAALLVGLALAFVSWFERVQGERAAEEVAREARRSEAILDTAGDGILGLDISGRIEFANRAAHDMLGARVGTLIGTPFASFLGESPVHNGPTRELCAYLDPAGGFASRRACEGLVLRGSGGTHFPADVVATRCIESDDVLGAVVAFRDVTERRRAEEERRRTDMRLRAIFDHAALGIAVLDGEGRIVAANRALAQAFGMPEAALLGRRGTEFLGAIHVDDTMDALARVRDGLRASTSVEVSVERPEGQPIDCRLTISRLDPASPSAGFVALVEDVTDRKELERQLVHQAFHDPLTQLANRALFFEQVAAALARDGRHPGAVATMFIDLDDFKLVNDQLGHHAGDELLKAVAIRLRGATRAGDTTARLAGDEFAILLEELHAPSEMTAVADRVLAAIAAPFTHGDRTVTISASIGVAQSIAGDDATQLLRRADIAMYQSKRGGKGAVELFDPALHGATMDRLQLEGDLRDVVERGELFVQYQPIVDLATGIIGSVEALVRWRHPERGVIPPPILIALAESTGHIVPIGRWVLREACRQLAAWDALDGTPRLSISVNVSLLQLEDDALVNDVEAALTDFGLEPARLQLEVTESALAADSDGVRQRLHALAERGVRLAIDDFGTGYSSLAYLQRFPVHVLKIDKAFIDGVAHGGTAAALTRTIIALGETLGLSTIAEGIEHDGQRTDLLGLGCSRGQGFLFARPLDPAAIAALLVRPEPEPAISGDTAVMSACESWGMAS